MKETDNPEQGARFESLIEALNLTQTAIAQTLGFSQSYVSQMVGGSRNISRRVLHFITKNYPDVNVHWILTGKGEMFLEKKEVEPVPVDGLLTGVMEERPPAYEKGEGRLEWLERKVEELLTDNERLREQQAELLLRLNELLRTQLEMNKRLADLEGGGEGMNV